MRPSLHLTPGATSGPLLLDGRSDVAAAYSFRRIRNAFQGALVRLRRDSDDTESDFGAGLPALDTSAIATWLGGADGFVVTWYDQSGNGRNLTQATAVAQPAYSASLGNGRPGMTFDGVDDYVRSGAFTLDQPHTRYALFRMVTVPGIGEAHLVAGHALTDGLLFFTVSGTATSINAGVTLDGGSTGMPVGTRAVVCAIYSGGSSRVEINGAFLTSATGNAGGSQLTGLTVGTRGDVAGSSFANAELQELIEFAGAHGQEETQTRNAAIRAAWGF